MNNPPIIIMGFGRSGTTWVSDIISKSLGGLILFEPFHPAVLANAEDFLYASGNPALLDQAINYGDWILAGNNPDRWLLRNHLPRDLDHTDPGFEAELWKECQILGYKEIRLNLMLAELRQSKRYRLVFTIRHPLAVLASIKKRTRFWLEFGFDLHYQKFLTETFYNKKYKSSCIQAKQHWLNKVATPLEKAALMWAVTHELLKDELEAKDVYLLNYEKLYAEPFAETHKLLEFLGYSRRNLHPSYLFTPSMTTHRTLHGGTDMETYRQQTSVFFWEGILTNHELPTICQILKDFSGPIHFELPF